MISDLANGFALSQIVLTLFFIFRLQKINLAEVLFACLLLAIGAYLTDHVIERLESHWLDWAWKAWLTYIPGGFLLACLATFNDEFKLRWWHLALVFSTMLLPFFYQVISFYRTGGPSLELLLVDLPQLLEFVLVSWSIWIVAASWRNDLVEERRQFRLLIMGFGATIIFSVITVQQLLSLKSITIDVVLVPVICVFLLLVNMKLLQWDYKISIFSHHLGEEKEKEVHASEVKIESPYLKKIVSLMENDKRYRQAGFTLSELSQLLHLSEYKLRKLINEEMAYRNFNEFLNNYRIKEASQALKSSEEPITNVAFNVGYKSLSSFNKAFKETHLVTPSEYRKNEKLVKNG